MDTQFLTVSQQENYDEKGCNLYLVPIHIR